MNPFLLQALGQNQEEEDPYRWRGPGEEDPNPFMEPTEDEVIPPQIEEPNQDMIIPPSVQGGENIFSPRGTVMEDYQSWLGRRPSEEDYAPSKGRKVLAGILGFLTGLKNPEAGAKVTRSLTRGGYDQALGDWEREGKTLGEVGKLQQDFGETRRKQISDVLGYESSKQRVGATRERTKAMVDAEKNRHATAMANAKTSAEKAAETKRHNSELEKLAKENISIDKMDAQTRRQNADTYRDKTTNKIPQQKEVRQAQNDATIEVVTEYPEFQEFFERDENNPRIIYPKENLSMSPEQREKYQIAVDLIRKRAQKKLTNPFGVDDFELGEPSESDEFDQVIPPRRGGI